MSKIDLKASLTATEKSTLAEFRSRVSHIYYETADERYLTWLRARDLNIDKAEQMLRRHLIWRRNNEIEKLVDWISPRNYLPYIDLGLDHDGEKVYLLPFGRMDLRSAVEQGDIVPSLRSTYKLLETLVATGASQNRYQGSIIIDFDGFTYRQISHRTIVQGIVEIVRIFENNYPEVLKHAFVINASKIFNLLFALIKPMLTSRSLGKIQIFNFDRAAWLAELLKHMPADVLPPHWGGTKPGSDEYCSDCWNQEPLPPYFMKKLNSTYDEFGEEWISMKINARDSLTLDYKLGEGREKEDSVLKWGFYTDSYDIGFSIAYQGISGAEEEEQVPYSRIESHASSKTINSLHVYKPGKYVVKFDNSYSRSRSKYIHFCISLTSVKRVNELDLLNGTNVVRHAIPTHTTEGTRRKNCRTALHEEDENFEDAVDSQVM